MMNEEQKREARNRIHDPATARAIISRLLEPAKEKVKGEPSYICPFCGHGKGGDGLSFVGPDEGRVHCFGSCQFSGDVSDIYASLYGVNGMQALEATAKLAGYEPSAEATRSPRTGETGKGDTVLPNREKPAQRATEAVTATTTLTPDISGYVLECAKHLHDREPWAYIESRGLAGYAAELEAFSIGYDPKTRRLIIPDRPSNPQTFEGRALAPDAKPRYLCPKGCPKALFNLEALYQTPDPENKASRAVFVTEGAFDALSFITLGYKAVSLNSTSNAPLLVKALQEKEPTATLILSLDKDGPGEKATATLEAELKRLNIRHIVAPSTLYGEAKDPNEAFTATPAEFMQSAWELVCDSSTLTKPDTVTAYLDRQFQKDIADFKSEVKTGYRNLDQETGGLYAGLYVIAAISSLGKTTFTHQMADQIARQGKPVVYFSLEQSKMELVSKSIARLTWMHRANGSPVDSLTIRKGCDSPQIGEAISFYREHGAANMNIVEGNFSCNLAKIEKYIRDFIEQNGERPVVVVDYLQILQPDPQEQRHQGTKEIVDQTVTALKRLSREFSIPVIAISSVNRSGYLAPIDFESLKESGGIEFTADVVWGLQLSIMDSGEFQALKKDDNVKKRDMVKEAKKESPRRVKLVCLKNRYGVSSYDCPFLYYPQYDYFEPEQQNNVPHYSARRV